MLTILGLILGAYFAGAQNSGLALAALVFFTVVRYGYHLALDHLVPFDQAGSKCSPQSRLKSLYAMVVGIGLTVLAIPGTGPVVVILAIALVMSCMHAWSRLDAREHCVSPALTGDTQ